MGAPDSKTCPVCRATFRATRQCSRCGADLAPLMLLMLSAHRLRAVARAALLQGDTARAQELAEEAQAQCATQQGANLELLARWLYEVEHSQPRRTRRS